MFSFCSLGENNSGEISSCDFSQFLAVDTWDSSSLLYILKITSHFGPPERMFDVCCLT